VNGFGIGIELDNAGALLRRGDGWTSAWGAPIDDADVVTAAHKHGGPVRGWHAYSARQLAVAADVANTLVRHYDLVDVVGHDDVSPGRKTDPGPAFPMQSFRARVMGRPDGEPAVERAQTTVALNIRTGPGTAFERLPASPLPAGTKLEILAVQGENPGATRFACGGAPAARCVRRGRARGARPRRVRQRVEAMLSSRA
jgi:N-acetylmuramoyl-L-alanine amidase